MSDPQIRTLTLTTGLTVAQAAALLGDLDPDDRLVCPDGRVTLAWLVVASLDHANSHDSEHDPVAAALAVPHLATIAGHLRHLPAAPGRPKIQDAALALRLEVRRPAADRIAGALAGLPWPPVWLPAADGEDGR